MTLVVVGTGALGSLFSARLSSTIDLIGFGHWEAHIERVNAAGLEVIGLDGTPSIHTYRMTLDTGELEGADAALVLVKAYQTEVAAREIAAFLKPGGRILTLQNGLGNLETLQEYNPAAEVIAGTTPIGATMLGPGRVRHAGEGSITLPETAGFWIDLLREAGFDVETHANIDSVIWGKLVINAGINPVTALLRQPNGFLATDPEARALMIAAAEEAAAVAAALGIELPYRDVAAAVVAVAERTAGNRSSMLQDLENGRPLELDAITGAVVGYGRGLGTLTPLNDDLYEQLNDYLDSAILN